MAGTASIALWPLENAGFSGWPPVFTKTYTSKAAYVGYRHECAYIPQRASGAASEAIARRAGLEIFRQSSSPDGKACYQPATTD